MKIKLIRDDLGVAHDVDREAMAEHIVYINDVPMWKVGTILDVPHRAAQLLVGNGDAEPADPEAEQACGDWRSNRSEVLLSREMLAKGIEPEDREAYRNGELQEEAE